MFMLQTYANHSFWDEFLMIICIVCLNTPDLVSFVFTYDLQLMSALEEDEVCNQHSLADRLHKVTSDIYPNECWQ